MLVLTCGAHAALYISNNKNVVIFIFVIAVEYEINLLRKFPELRYIAIVLDFCGLEGNRGYM